MKFEILLNENDSEMNMNVRMRYIINFELKLLNFAAITQTDCGSGLGNSDQSLLEQDGKFQCVSDVHRYEDIVKFIQ